MKLRTLASLTALSAALSLGCNKSQTPAPAKAEGAPAAAAAAPVTPAAPTPAPTAPAAPEAVAVDAGSGIKVENLKVEPVAPGTDPKGVEAAVDNEPRITGPVAVVNGQNIDSKDYYEELDKILTRSAKIPAERLNRIKENILKRLIEKELIVQAVKKAAVAVPEADIDAEFDEYKKRFRTEEQFQSYLTHGKVTIDSIKARIREKKELELLLEKSGKLAVTDAEIDDFYKKNARFYEEREGIKARHILVKLAENASKEEDEKALARVKEAKAELDKGTPFEQVAEKYSEGPSAPKGGDLGFFGRGQMVKPFEDKAFTMKPGERSEPVRTRFGYHVIEVLEKREARQKALEEVKPTIAESLKNKKFFQERRDLINTLRTEAAIEEKIVIPKSAMPEPHTEGGERGAPPMGRMPEGAPPAPGGEAAPAPAPAPAPEAPPAPAPAHTP
jgi:peptidyl-prolyl cis-trans isomerase C